MNNLLFIIVTILEAIIVGLIVRFFGYNVALLSILVQIYSYLIVYLHNEQ